MGSLGYCVHFPERITDAFMEWGTVIYQPKRMTSEAYDEAFEACLAHSNYTLVIDEIDKFARPRWYISDNLNELINRGRAQGIGLICNSRRPHKMHNDIRSNADYIVCFQLHEERDLKYMSEWMATGSENIKTLPSYHSLLFDVRRNRTVMQAPCPDLS